jgi:hypothetical protein
MFVGRAEETRRIAAAIGEGARIVTLWGPGGAGKTTLARRVEPAIWVDLASARTAEDVVTAFAAALDVEAEEAAVVHAAEMRAQRIVGDNVEQIGAEGRAMLVRLITANSFILPDGRTVDLSKRKNIRLVLAALTKSKDRAQWTTPDALIAAGWPGERMRSDAATKRLHTAIWTLRKLGLEGILQSSETGYRLDPEITLELRSANA